MIGVTTGADRDAIMAIDDITFTPQCVKFNGTIPTIPPTTPYTGPTTTAYTGPATTTTTTVYTGPPTTSTTTVYTEPSTPTTTTTTGTTTTPRGKDDFFYKNKIV